MKVIIGNVGKGQQEVIQNLLAEEIRAGQVELDPMTRQAVFDMNDPLDTVGGKLRQVRTRSERQSLLMLLRKIRTEQEAASGRSS